MNKLRIRKILKKDHYAVIEMANLISKYKPLNKKYNQIWKNYIKQKNALSIVAVIDNEIVGFGSIFFMTQVRGGIKGSLETIVVKEKFQKNNIGFNIVKKLLEFATKKNCYKVELATSVKNIKFYNKLNFRRRSIVMSNFIKKKNV